MNALGPDFTPFRYAIGGFNGHERLRTVEVYDPDSRVWREVATLNNKRSALGAAVIGDRLFVCKYFHLKFLEICLFFEFQAEVTMESLLCLRLNVTILNWTS